MATATMSRAKARKTAGPDDRTVTRASTVFGLLSDATRLRVLLLLDAAGEMYVGAMCERLGQSQPAVSHHLSLMRHSELIGPRRDGKQNFYSLTDRGREAVKAVRAMNSGKFFPQK